MNMMPIYRQQTNIFLFGDCQKNCNISYWDGGRLHDICPNMLLKLWFLFLFLGYRNNNDPCWVHFWSSFLLSLITQRCKYEPVFQNGRPLQNNHHPTRAQVTLWAKIIHVLSAHKLDLKTFVIKMVACKTKLKFSIKWKVRALDQRKTMAANLKLTTQTWQSIP